MNAAELETILNTWRRASWQFTIAKQDFRAGRLGPGDFAEACKVYREACNACDLAEAELHNDFIASVINPFSEAVAGPVAVYA